MSAPRPTPTRIGPYQLIRLLGLGSIAQVYHAQRVEGGEAVALKVPRLPLMANPTACERFVQRARDNLRMGPHHNIVTTLDVGLDGELPYVAMEYVRGVELGRLVEAMRKANLRWPTAAISWVLVGILRALSHAFGAKFGGTPLHLTHRDLRSSQVVVTHEGEVKVTDLGLSGLAGPGPLGSASGRTGPATDMPAVGRIGWAMIEGQSYCVPDCSTDETLTFARRGPGPTLSRGSIPKALVELIHALLDSNEQTGMPNPRRALAALEACPGLNLSEPEPVRRLLARFFSNRQEAAHTIVERRIHPELVALEGTLSPGSGGVTPRPPPRSIIVRRRAEGVPPVQHGRGSDDTVPASVDVHLPPATASVPTLTRGHTPSADLDSSSTASMPSTPAHAPPTPVGCTTASLPTATFEPSPVLPPSDSTATDLLGSGLSTSTSTHPLPPLRWADASVPPPSSSSLGLPPLPANLPTASESTPMLDSAATPLAAEPASPAISPPRNDHSVGWEPGVGALTIAPQKQAPMVGEIISSDAAQPVAPPVHRMQPEAARSAMVPLYVPLPKLDPVPSTPTRRWWPWAVVLCVVGLALGGFVLTATLLADGPTHGHAGPIGERLRPIPLPASPSNCDDASVAARTAPLGFS